MLYVLKLIIKTLRNENVDVQNVAPGRGFLGRERKMIVASKQLSRSWRVRTLRFWIDYAGFERSQGIASLVSMMSFCFYEANLSKNPLFLTVVTADSQLKTFMYQSVYANFGWERATFLDWQLPRAYQNLWLRDGQFRTWALVQKCVLRLAVNVPNIVLFNAGAVRLRVLRVQGRVKILNLKSAGLFPNSHY